MFINICVVVVFLQYCPMCCVLCSIFFAILWNVVLCLILCCCVCFAILCNVVLCCNIVLLCFLKYCAMLCCFVILCCCVCFSILCNIVQYCAILWAVVFQMGRVALSCGSQLGFSAPALNQKQINTALSPTEETIYNHNIRLSLSFVFLNAYYA